MNQVHSSSHELSAPNVLSDVVKRYIETPTPPVLFVKHNTADETSVHPEHILQLLNGAVNASVVCNHTANDMKAYLKSLFASRPLDDLLIRPVVAFNSATLAADFFQMFGTALLRPNVGMILIFVNGELDAEHAKHLSAFLFNKHPVLHMTLTPIAENAPHALIVHRPLFESRKNGSIISHPHSAQYVMSVLYAQNLASIAARRMATSNYPNYWHVLENISSAAVAYKMRALQDTHIVGASIGHNSPYGELRTRAYDELMYHAASEWGLMPFDRHVVYSKHTKIIKNLHNLLDAVGIQHILLLRTDSLEKQRAVLSSYNAAGNRAHRDEMYWLSEQFRTRVQTELEKAITNDTISGHFGPGVPTNMRASLRIGDGVQGTIIDHPDVHWVLLTDVVPFNIHLAAASHLHVMDPEPSHTPFAVEHLLNAMRHGSPHSTDVLQLFAHLSDASENITQVPFDSMPPRRVIQRGNRLDPQPSSLAPLRDDDAAEEYTAFEDVGCGRGGGDLDAIPFGRSGPIQEGPRVPDIHAVVEVSMMQDPSITWSGNPDTCPQMERRATRQYTFVPCGQKTAREKKIISDSASVTAWLIEQSSKRSVQSSCSVGQRRRTPVYSSSEATAFRLAGEQGTSGLLELVQHLQHTKYCPHLYAQC